VGLEMLRHVAVVRVAAGTDDEDDPLSVLKVDKGTAGWAGTGATGAGSLRGSFET